MPQSRVPSSLLAPWPLALLPPSSLATVNDLFVWQVPQRGVSACTYIAGVATVRFAVRNELPDGPVWADCIGRGVQAYHAAKVGRLGDWEGLQTGLSLAEIGFSKGWLTARRD